MFVVLALSVWTACAPSPAPTPQPEPAPAPAVARTDWSEIQLVLYKSERRLHLYRRGVYQKSWPVVLGLAPEGPKRWQDDARTPEGYYHIIAKRPHPRWKYFLTIDYPNNNDYYRYARLRQEGRVPVLDAAPLPIGGNVGFHGTDKHDKQARGEDWTKGCISMDNAAIAELYDLVDVGTEVWLLE